VARESFGNGYKGRAATSRKMRANSRGFADHSPRSLKPVHGGAGGRVDRRVDRKAGRRVYWGERLAG
jgi:hypothetical protein